MNGSAGKGLRRVSNPPNPWQAAQVEWVGEAPAARLRIYEDHSRTILSRNDNPELGFRWSVNPYRGCTHACSYCYARASHQHLDFGAGTDFDRKIVVKPKAAELLERAFRRRTWRSELVAFSGNTDCYQPLEAAWGLTRACLEVCLKYRNPVSIVTKSALIERDLPLLVALADMGRCRVAISIPTADRSKAKALEPGAPSPARRWEALSRLAQAGVPVGVMMAPIIPGLNDTEIVTILEKARECGACYAWSSLLWLSEPVQKVFSERLRSHFPQSSERVLAQLRDCRRGSLDRGGASGFRAGVGPRWEAIASLWRLTCKRLGLQSVSTPHGDESRHESEFSLSGQLSLL